MRIRRIVAGAAALALAGLAVAGCGSGTMNVHGQLRLGG